MTGPVLYITFDGVLQPLGFSQVVRMVAELARSGVRYALLSVERRSDLANSREVERVRSVLASAGVEWQAVATDSTNRGLRRSAGTLAQVLSSAARIVRRDGVVLVHARSYQAGAVAYGLRRVLGVPYLFDARGCWIEERSTPGDWFSQPGRYAAGKFFEQKLLRNAAAIVTLTTLHATDIRAGLGAKAPLIEVIPTCADYATFALAPDRPAKPAASTVLSHTLRATLAGKTVVGVLGAVNPSYRTTESLRLARLATVSSANVHLLILSKQQDEYRLLLDRVRFPSDRVSIADATHDQMPDWLRWIDWGLLLLDDTAAKRGSVPTKLAEFFSAGVRPMGYGCNAEMIGWIHRAGSGHVLETLEDASVAEAANVLATSPIDVAALQAARRATEAHFGLVQGVKRYERVIDHIARPG